MLNDALLERFLQERARSAASFDLVPAVMAAVAAAPQQRAIGAGFLGGLRAMDRRTAALAAVLLALMAAAIVIVGSALIHTNEVVIAPTRSPVASAGPSRSAPTTETPDPDLPPGEPIAVADIPFLSFDAPCCTWSLASDSIGWLYSEDESTARRFPPQLYRTTDDGSTWRQIALPHGAAFGRIRPIDTETVFVVYDEAGPASIAVTHDAGRTWREATIEDGSGDVELYEGTDGLWARGSRVWRSVDGGLTWTSAGTRIPPTGLLFGDEAGVRGGLVWAQGGEVDGAPFDNHFVLSSDGGVSWNVRAFPVDDLLKAAEPKGIAGATRLEDGRLVIGVLGGDPVALAVYSSSDGGSSWQRLEAVHGSSAISFLDAHHWVVFGAEDNTYVVTGDAGQSWNQTRMGTTIQLDRGDLLALGHLWDLRRCADHLNGLGGPRETADPRCLPGESGVLLESFDGGVTWKRLGS